MMVLEERSEGQPNQSVGGGGSFDLRVALDLKDLRGTKCHYGSSSGDPHQIKWSADWHLHPQALLLDQIWTQLTCW